MASPPSALLLRFIVCIGLVNCDYSNVAKAFKPSVLKPSPVLFVPGLIRSTLNVYDTTNTSCNTNGGTYKIWLNTTLSSTAPGCFQRQLKLDHSIATAAGYSDSHGVTITAAHFDGVEDDIIEGYLFDFLKYFTSRGYTKDKDIRVASYDWRLSPEQLNWRGFYSTLRQLIHKMYVDNNNTKVTLVVHSLGGPVSLYFLTNTVSQEWKDKYIHSYITLAGAWSGGNAIVRYLLSGPGPEDDISRALKLSDDQIRSLYRTFPSFYLLLPRASAWNDTVIVTSPTRNYTANSYRELFADAGYPQGYAQFSDSETSIEWTAPNVATYCFYGLGVPTPMRFNYGNIFPDAAPTVDYGNGDGYINKPSSELCLRWRSNDHYFNRTVFPGIDHTQITSNYSVLEAIGDIVGASKLSPKNDTVRPRQKRIKPTEEL